MAYKPLVGNRFHLNSQCLIACVRAHKMTTGGGALVLLSWEDVKLSPRKKIEGYFILLYFCLMLHLFFLFSFMPQPAEYGAEE